MTPVFDYAAGLRDGMATAQWLTEDLWIASVALSGRLDQRDVSSITSGARSPSPFEYNILAAALNDHLGELASGASVRYWHEQPT